MHFGQPWKISFLLSFELIQIARTMKDSVIK